MNRNVSLCTIALFLIPLLITASAEALVSIQPQARSLSIFSNMTFTVNINISGVDNVYGFQFDLGYNSNVLEIVSISEGRFLNRSGADRTFCVDINNTNPNFPNIPTPGLVNDIACSRIGNASVNGTGVLANATFRLKTVTQFPATSSIALSDVKLSDINLQQLNNNSQNGLVTVYECLSGESRSCTISSCQGIRTCNASNQWGSCSVSPQPETCDGLDNNCDGYTDNGPGISGNYTLNRSCSLGRHGICAVGIETCQQISPGIFNYTGCPLPQEEICDNSIDEDCNNADPLCMGDANGDHCVSMLDLVLIGVNFGLTSFDPRADRNNDGAVNIFDLVTAGKEFGLGSCCPDGC
jgi:hypothetical protein